MLFEMLIPSLTASHRLEISSRLKGISLGNFPAPHRFHGERWGAINQASPDDLSALVDKGFTPTEFFH